MWTRCQSAQPARGKQTLPSDHADTLAFPIDVRARTLRQLYLSWLSVGWTSEAGFVPCLHHDRGNTWPEWHDKGSCWVFHAKLETSIISTQYLPSSINVCSLPCLVFLCADAKGQPRHTQETIRWASSRSKLPWSMFTVTAAYVVLFAYRCASYTSLTFPFFSPFDCCTHLASQRKENQRCRSTTLRASRAQGWSCRSGPPGSLRWATLWLATILLGLHDLEANY